jgi:hypothetical protein
MCMYNVQTQNTIMNKDNEQENMHYFGKELSHNQKKC